MVQVDGVPRPTDFGGASTLTAWLHVTNDCNLRCPYCYVSKSRDEMTEGVGLAAVERVIASAARQQ